MSIDNWENEQWNGEDPTSLATDLVDKGIVREGTHLLDLGCGFGRNANWFASKGVIVNAVNINQAELDEAKKRADENEVTVNYVKADAGQLPFRDSSFDVLLDAGCTHMCDRETQEKAVIEAARVLKPGGYLQFFGFSKEHPAYKNKPDSPQFRNLDDIKQQYGELFDIIGEPQRKEWKHSNQNHIGLEILMKRKV